MVWKDKPKEKKNKYI